MKESNARPRSELGNPETSRDSPSARFDASYATNGQTFFGGRDLTWCQASTSCP